MEAGVVNDTRCTLHKFGFSRERLVRNEVTYNTNPRNGRCILSFPETHCEAEEAVSL